MSSKGDELDKTPLVTKDKTMNNPSHVPVMLTEILTALDPQPGQVVVDGTLGLGGHSLLLARKISPEGLLIGLDWDEKMLEIARRKLSQLSGARIELIHDSFDSIPQHVEELCKAHQKPAQANAILLDLGLNTTQIEDPARGISFLQDGPLDMRMDKSRGEPAAAILNRVGPDQIERSLSAYGDERFAKSIAKAILARRKQSLLRTTSDLVECVLEAIPPRLREKRIHPATRTFQAMRIWVNRELDLLESSLEPIAQTLAPGGRLAVLSYHSGEDRIAKQIFKKFEAEGYRQLFKKPLTPSQEEIRQNPKARSAKLRVLERLTQNNPTERKRQ